MVQLIRQDYLQGAQFFTLYTYDFKYPVWKQPGYTSYSAN
jgi:hypothetical protein